MESFEDEYVSEPKNVDLKILSLGVKASPKALASFFDSIGSKLRPLTIMNGGTDRMQHSQVIAAIGRRCFHLEHFTLKHGMIAIEGFGELLGALRDDFGVHLLSLNLCGFSVWDYPVMHPAMEMLAQPGRLPRLQELRLDEQPVTLETLVSLDEALRFREKFQYIELQDPVPSEYEPETPLTHKREEFDALHQDEVLKVKSVPSMSQRAAFLSVIGDNSRSPLENRSSANSAHSAVDSEMVSAIFKFAGK